MKKIPCLFVREFDSHDAFTLTDQVAPGCGWALLEGRATVKFDGTACLVEDGRLFKRFDRKQLRNRPGEYKPAPDGWVECDSPDATTGHWPGWVPVGDEPESKWHRQAWEYNSPGDGTYELCGPRVQGNPHGFDSHRLVPHGALVYSPIRTFLGIRYFLANHEVEGLVFHHDDGRMVKIRRDDYGLPWAGKRGRERYVRLDGVRHRASCAVVDGLACVCGGGALAVQT